MKTTNNFMMAAARVFDRAFWSWALLLALIVPWLAGCASSSPPKPAPTKAAAAVAPTNSVSPEAKPAPVPDLASNPPPVVRALNTNLPTIFIAGDSTAARGAGESQQGWAVPFADYFDPTKVNVANRARGGRSSRTYITEGLWDQLLANVKAGDIVLIQFGHNDGGPPFTAPFRGSVPGLGEETREGVGRNGTNEVVHSFGWYMRKMIADTKAKGATPIVLSLTVRDIWRNGRIERGSGRYSQWSAEIAKAARVQFINVTDTMADKFDAMGQEKVKALYPRDPVHFNAVGADMHAAAAVSLLKGLRPGPVRRFLSAKGEAVEADRFGWLNLPRPANPALPSLFLIGDSTVRNGRGDGAGNQWGWGDFLGAHFDTNKLNVVNRAVGGISSRTFLTSGYWDQVMAMLKPGDFVMMQFGHNDNGSPTTGRTSIKGVGEETVEATDPATKKAETVHTFGWYERKYIADARAKGATPIVCSLIPRKIWKDGKIVRNKETHAGWAEQVAKSENAPFVDLNEIIARHYDELGPEKVDPLFGDPHTHTTAAGAELNAQCVIEGLKGLKEDPLETFLREP